MAVIPRRSFHTVVLVGVVAVASAAEAQVWSAAIDLPSSGACPAQAMNRPGPYAVGWVEFDTSPCIICPGTSLPSHRRHTSGQLFDLIGLEVRGQFMAHGTGARGHAMLAFMHGDPCYGPQLEYGLVVRQGTAEPNAGLIHVYQCDQCTAGVVAPGGTKSETLVYGAPAVNYRKYRIYVASSSTLRFEAEDPYTGSIEWTFDVPITVPSIGTSPIDGFVTIMSRKDTNDDFLGSSFFVDEVKVAR